MITMWCLELRRISDGSTYSASIISSMMRATMVRRITATLSEAASTTRLLVWSTSGTEAEGATKRLAGEKLMCHMICINISSSTHNWPGLEGRRRGERVPGARLHPSSARFPHPCLWWRRYYAFIFLFQQLFLFRIIIWNTSCINILTEYRPTTSSIMVITLTCINHFF